MMMMIKLKTLEVTKSEFDSRNAVNEGDGHFAGPQASEGEKRPPGPRVHSP